MRLQTVEGFFWVIQHGPRDAAKEVVAAREAVEVAKPRMLTSEFLTAYVVAYRLLFGRLRFPVVGSLFKGYQVLHKLGERCPQPPGAPNLDDLTRI